MTPTDLMFLFSESRGHPANMGLLFLLDPPVGAGPEFVREFYDALVANDEFQPTFRKHPATIGGGIAQLAWAYDEHIDVDHHVRLSALPAPARVRDLFELTSRLHASSFDRDRPLWELHVLEGLADGRFAMYVKLHHILFDGVALLNLVRRTYSVDPSDLGMRAMWSLPWVSDQQSDLPSRPASLGKRVGSIAGLALSTVKLARAALIEQQLTMPFAAPPSMFNVKIGQARQYAAQSWALERIMRVKQAAGVTVNDAVLAMCAGALRYYLIEQEALPDAPLIALVPVSLRPKEGADAGGNMVGSILCNLATHLEDPGRRLETIGASMRASKNVLADQQRVQGLALFAMTTVAPLARSGFLGAVRPPFNLVISNVPGLPEPMYYRGARVDAGYPLSSVMDGQALNITMVSNSGNLDFGLIACRRGVPSLQRLLGHLESSLKDLEQAVGV